MIIPIRSLSRKVFQHARRYELRLSLFAISSQFYFVLHGHRWNVTEKKKRKKKENEREGFAFAEKSAFTALSLFFSLCLAITLIRRSRRFLRIVFAVCESLRIRIARHTTAGNISQYSFISFLLRLSFEVPVWVNDRFLLGTRIGVYLCLTAAVRHELARENNRTLGRRLRFLRKRGRLH